MTATSVSDWTTLCAPSMWPTPTSRTSDRSMAVPTATRESELALLGGDPRPVPDSLVREFAEEVLDHWDEQQYGPMWRRFAPRIIPLLVVNESGIDVCRLLRGLGPVRRRVPRLASGATVGDP
jgi:hypothetical protein